MARLNGLFVMDRNAFSATYGLDEQRRIAELIDVVAPPRTAAEARLLSPSVLSRVDVLISGWGGLTLDEPWLERTPRLRAVFHGAGSVSRLMTTDAWKRGLIVSSAQDANAIPVAEYTLAMIILSLKRAWRLAGEMKMLRAQPSRDGIAGCFGRVVGLVSLGAVGRAVAAHLARLEVTVLASDPHVSAADAAMLGVTLVPLDELFARSDVVSVHTPSLPSTERMITGAHISALKHGATFINTSRGAIVCEDELIAVAAARGDVQIVLDVTEQSPPAPESPLYTLPNVLLTPHIAGSCGDECRRLGRWITSELERYVHGAPLRSQVTFEQALTSSHRSAEAVA